tara:strand:- start:87 stop:314 length:228 start_codon:yes stop_codon:yes gene_type:complete
MDYQSLRRGLFISACGLSLIAAGYALRAVEQAGFNVLRYTSGVLDGRLIEHRQMTPVEINLHEREPQGCRQHNRH